MDIPYSLLNIQTPFLVYLQGKLGAKCAVSSQSKLGAVSQRLAGARSHNWQGVTRHRQQIFTGLTQT